jgi:hypothetical protein
MPEIEEFEWIVWEPSLARQGGDTFLRGRISMDLREVTSARDCSSASGSPFTDVRLRGGGSHVLTIAYEEFVKHWRQRTSPLRAVNGIPGAHQTGE